MPASSVPPRQATGARWQMLTVRGTVGRSVLAALVVCASFAVFVGQASAAANDCKDNGYLCTPEYTGANANGTWSWTYYGAGWASTTTGYHNCTLYAAWRLAM